jgi:aspartyl-tRNA(Asn)/glutamyl-tRNA(Gln) amidotransferase subunit B
MSDLLRQLNRYHHTPQQAPVTPVYLAEMLQMVEEGVISGRIAKTVFEEMYRSGKPPRTIVAEQGLLQMADSGALAEVIAQVLAANPAQVTEYRAGREKLFGFFVGQIMKATQGKANPKLVNELLSKALQTAD